MTARGSKPDVVPSDEVVDSALRLARLWRRLAEHRTWRPVADAPAVRETLRSPGLAAASLANVAVFWIAQGFGWTLPGVCLGRLARNTGLCRDRFTALDPTGQPELDFTGLPTPATALAHRAMARSGSGPAVVTGSG
jgi:hypothetical protein